MDKEITFVVQNYREGAFNANEAWNRLGIVATPVWRRARVTAAMAAFVVFIAVASVVFYNRDTTSQSTPEEITPIENSVVATQTIDFENTSLPEVISAIKATYGVEVENVPTDSTSYHLSLHYDGTAVDLVDTINEILGTQMIVVP